MQGCGIKGCGVQRYRAVGYGVRECGNMGLWVVGCEDTELHVREMQGNGAAGYRDAALWGTQLRGCRIWEYRAAGCGIHDCRMRDVGTREAGYG